MTVSGGRRAERRLSLSFALGVAVVVVGAGCGGSGGGGDEVVVGVTAADGGGSSSSVPVVTSDGGVSGVWVEVPSGTFEGVVALVEEGDPVRALGEAERAVRLAISEAYAQAVESCMADRGFDHLQEVGALSASELTAGFFAPLPMRDGERDVVAGYGVSVVTAEDLIDLGGGGGVVAPEVDEALRGCLAAGNGAALERRDELPSVFREAIEGIAAELAGGVARSEAEAVWVECAAAVGVDDAGPAALVDRLHAEYEVVLGGEVRPNGDVVVPAEPDMEAIAEFQATELGLAADLVDCDRAYVEALTGPAQELARQALADLGVPV